MSGGAGSTSRQGPLFWLGSAGLLVAMGTDAIAVAGRHLGHPLLGSIEVVQAAILVAASAAMLSATLAGAHATVHLLVDRMGPRGRSAAMRLADLLSALLFAGFAAGSAWLLADLWSAHEQSDLLHLPFRPLRAIVTVASIAMVLVFLRRAIAGQRAA